MWWNYIEKQRVAKGKARVRTWSRMKRILKERFVPLNYKYTLMTIEGDTLEMEEEKAYEGSEAEKGKLVGGDGVLEPEQEGTKGEMKISSNLECPSFPKEEGNHVEKEESLEVTFDVGTKLGGPQTKSIHSKEVQFCVPQGIILIPTLASMNFELNYFGNHALYSVVNLGSSGEWGEFWESKSCLDVLGRGVKKKGVLKFEIEIMSEKDREHALGRVSLEIMHNEQSIGLPILNPKLLHEEVKFGSDFELWGINCDHDYVRLNLEKCMVPCDVELTPCVEGALEDDLDSSQAGGNDAGASIHHHTSLKHKWKEKKNKRFLTSK